MALGRSRSTRKKEESLATVRRSQVVTTYGIGSLIPVEQESFIVLGQEYWPAQWREIASNGKRINEIQAGKFANALGVAHLFLPPTDEFFRLPVKRFPEFYLCPRCERLSYWSQLATPRENDRMVNQCRHCKVESATLRPSRFVAVCADGHIQDFPYHNWVHQGKDDFCNAAENQLYISANPRDDSLRGLIVTCSCGAKRTLEGALGRARIGKCQGKSPWLPKDPEHCSRDLVGLQRGATSVWQSQVKSTITVPEESKNSPIGECFNENMDWFTSTPANRLEQTIRMAAADSGVDPEALRTFTLEKLGQNGTASSLEDLRDLEYGSLQEPFPDDGHSADFLCVPVALGQKERDDLRLDALSSVPRLREIRALAGFYRLDPGANDEHPAAALLSKTRQNWLPAIEAWGEGIFLKFDEASIAAWEKAPWPVERLERIQNASSDPRAGSASLRHLLLHSLSHILINQLALQAGYTASSIRERIYSKPGQAGILLYTAGTDSAGSLGGLAALATPEKVREIVLGALETARWCTADPVCIESGVRGLDSLNLAACHFCMFVPEVSCESNNMLLDRALLVGTTDDPDKGFYSELF